MRVFEPIKTIYDKNSYPIDESKEKDNGVTSHYDVWRLDEGSRNCCKSLIEMWNLSDLYNHAFTKMEIVNQFLTDFKYRVVIGGYDTHENSVISGFKKELLCKKYEFFILYMANKEK